MEEKQKQTNDKNQNSFEPDRIKWENVVFLPFNPLYKFCVIVAVSLKTYMGPLRAIRNRIHCKHVETTYLQDMMRTAYTYYCNYIYMLDILLHIAHRQVKETAVRREYLPKPVTQLLVDIFGVLPLFASQVTNVCTQPVTIWPHILAFSEFVLIYRIIEYFKVSKSHNILQRCFGILIVAFLSINCIRCFWFLVTTKGFCINCTPHNDTFFPDWRQSLRRFTTYKVRYSDFALNYIVSIFTGTCSAIILKIAKDRLTTTLWQSGLLVLSYCFKIFLILPKMFSEAVLSNKHTYYFQKRVERILNVTKRRTDSSKTLNDIQKFYQVMWTMRSGTFAVPKIIHELPTSLILEIKEDLYWPLFYHSPTFRRTTIPYRRWVSGNVRYEFKMPGDKLYSGPQCHSHLYYIKTGIVQLISLDDNATPILSVTSGTIFGDINFILPALKHKVTARCITYCEIHYISREVILRSLHKFPEDRRMIMQRANERIKHAQKLNDLKNIVETLDITDNIGIAWIKRRWWQLFSFYSNPRTSVSSSKLKEVEIPPEENNYRCSKYIGQLVLYNESHLHNRSIFFKSDFPWILAPDSLFLYMWLIMVKITVILVLIIYPPMFSTLHVRTPFTFTVFKLWTDFVYIVDILVSILTFEKKDEREKSMVDILLKRFKTKKIILDVLSTSLLSGIVSSFGVAQYYDMFQYSRLLKLHIFFASNKNHKQDFLSNPVLKMLIKCFLIFFSFLYISSFFLFLITTNFQEVSKQYFFCATTRMYTNISSIPWTEFDVFKTWLSNYFLNMCPGRSQWDVNIVMTLNAVGFLLMFYINGNMMAAIYLRYQEIIHSQFITSCIKGEFVHYNIHPNLIRRLEKYFLCKWKTSNIVYNIKEEPFSIYHTIHDQVAEKILRNSRVFKGAEPALVKELANRAKFMILPQYSTLFMLGSQCDVVLWGIQGTIQCEFIGDSGHVVTKIFPLGELMSTSSVFFGDIAIRTYTALTDCEVLFLPVSQFWDILRRYPAELVQIRLSQKEICPLYQQLVCKYIYKTQEYRQNLLRSRTQSLDLPDETIVKKISGRKSYRYVIRHFWVKPDSKFTKKWMTFRAAVIILSILIWCFQGGPGARYRRQLQAACLFADLVSYADILLKLFMGYFNEDGLLIYNTKMCMKHYISRGFIADLIGALPWADLVGERFNNSQKILIMTLSRTAHLYLVDGYFNYLGNRPSSNLVSIMIVKFHVIGLLLMAVCCQIDLTLCIDYTWDENFELLNITLKSQLCWTGKDPNLSTQDMYAMFARSLLHCLLEFVRNLYSLEELVYQNPFIFMIIQVTKIMYWFIYTFTATILILKFQGSSVYEDGVRQLKAFLINERVEKDIIRRAVDYYVYLHSRTSGVGTAVQSLPESFGFILRQDINHFFYKRTLLELGKLISLGPHTRRILASSCQQLFFLAGEDIMREMDVVPQVFIVHRGEVVVSKEKKIIARLRKGSIFGQLFGIQLRPVKVTVRTEVPADLLSVPIKTFQDICKTNNTKVREIGNNDFIIADQSYKENPYNSIDYIVRGKKTIKLPWMEAPRNTHQSLWYSNWLLLTWLLEPTFSTCISILFLLQMDETTKIYLLICLVVLDIIHIANTVTDYLYALHVSVVDGKCQLITNKYDRSRQWSFIADLLTLLPPYLSIFTGVNLFHLARVSRIRHIFHFKKHFCNSFQNEIKSNIYRLVTILICVHIMCCIFMKGFCERPTDITKFSKMNTSLRRYNYKSMCTFRDDHNTGDEGLLRWAIFYLYSLSSLISLHSGRKLDLDDKKYFTTFNHIFLAVIIYWCLYVIDLFVLSKITCIVFVKCRNIYKYDYKVRQLLHYLSDAGVSQVLLNRVHTYTKHLWDRQKGTWIPELALQAPQCIREDIMCSLYLHHLLVPTLFRDVPQYFLRQLAAKFRRIVMFPDKHIVQAGDIMPYAYFINEGEVEKYYLDKNGEKRLMGLLTTNGHFGVFPGIFPNTPFQCSYYTRTVVDLVYLKSEDWQSLLESYPDIKQLMMESAQQFGVELGIHEAFFS